MRRRKRHKRQGRQPQKPRSQGNMKKTEVMYSEIKARRSPYSDEQGQARGIARAAATFDEALRRPPYRDVLKDIDRLVRSPKKGTA